MGISLSGLSTGIDTRTIVAQLMAIERQPRQALVIKQDQATARQNAIKDVISKLQTLATAAADLRSSSLWANVQTATSSDATKVAVVSASGAASGFSASGQTIVEDTTQRQYGADAQFTVNGVAKTSASNTNVTNAILG